MVARLWSPWLVRMRKVYQGLYGDIVEVRHFDVIILAFYTLLVHDYLWWLQCNSVFSLCSLWLSSTLFVPLICSHTAVTCLLRLRSRISHSTMPFIDDPMSPHFNGADSLQFFIDDMDQKMRSAMASTALSLREPMKYADSQGCWSCHFGHIVLECHFPYSNKIQQRFDHVRRLYVILDSKPEPGCLHFWLVL